MQLGMVGLGRMGANMVRRLMRGGHSVRRLRPRTRARSRRWSKEGATGAASLEELVAQARRRRAPSWVMVPAGGLTEQTSRDARRRCSAPGDTIIDGGNSYFKDDVRRAKELAAKGIHYVDVGTSGGVWGARARLLPDGRRRRRRPFARLEPDLRRRSPRARATIAATPGRDGKAGTAPSRATSTAAPPAPATS